MTLRGQGREVEVFAVCFLIPEEELNTILKEELLMDFPNPIPGLVEEFQLSVNFMRKKLEFASSKADKPSLQASLGCLRRQRP